MVFPIKWKMGEGGILRLSHGKKISFYEKSNLKGIE